MKKKEEEHFHFLSWMYLSSKPSSHFEDFEQWLANEISDPALADCNERNFFDEMIKYYHI